MRIMATASYQGGRAGAIAEALAAAATRACSATADHVLTQASVLVPVESGELLGSGNVTHENDGVNPASQVNFDSEHAAFNEFGTGLRGASSEGRGPYAYDPDWPGMPATPYLRPALDASRELFFDNVSGEVRNAL